MLQFLWIGNPENRRCQFFLEAIQKEGFPPPILLSYKDILYQQINWREILKSIDWIRIESPGENAAVAQGLLKSGAAKAGSKALAPDFLLSKGSIAGLQQQHFGFLKVLDELEQALKAFPSIQLVNSLAYIRLCFDKQQCHRHLQQQGIAVPPALYGVQNYEDLRAQMAKKRWHRVFIKPIHGSSASGVVAFRTQGKKVQAITSVEMQMQQDKVQLFNSLQLSHYKTEKEIALLINQLAKEDILVEQWIPKASLGNAVFDLRMVIIGGQCQQVVVRQSQSPLTNLHLGNKRGEIEALKEKMGLAAWQQVQQLAEQAAATLPTHHYACLDVLVQTHFKQAYILEVNAFGDLLPRVTYKGRDTYAASLHHLKQVHYV